jgi:hypothetical protein
MEAGTKTPCGGLRTSSSTDVGFAIWSGGGTPTRRLTPMPSGMLFFFVKAMERCRGARSSSGGLFPRADWLVWFEGAGLTPSGATDSSGREIFLATPHAVVEP